MKIEEIAEKYTREQYIDYGDLNEKAEKQIKEAVIFGMNHRNGVEVTIKLDNKNNFRAKNISELLSILNKIGCKVHVIIDSKGGSIGSFNDIEN